jgi:hypothetical protein
MRVGAKETWTCSGFQRNAKRYAKDFRPLVAFLFSKDDRTATALPSVHSPETLGTISMHRRQIEVPDDPHVPGTLLHSSVSQKSGAFNSRWKFSNSPYVYSHGGWHATIRSHDERYHSTTLLFLLACSLCCSSQLSIPIHSYIYLIIYSRIPEPTNSKTPSPIHSPFYLLLPPPLGVASISIGAASNSTGMKAS